MPSEDHSQPEATKALNQDEGRWERDGNHQKKAMKTKSTKSQSAPGLRVQSSNHQAGPVAAAAAAEQSGLLHIDHEQRKANRLLPTEQVLDLLQRRLRRAYELAEIVGQWVWVQFSERQPREITAELSQLGFHWNNQRQAWQHPCGHFTTGTQRDPRATYGSRFAADSQAA